MLSRPLNFFAAVTVNTYHLIGLPKLKAELMFVILSLSRPGFKMWHNFQNETTTIAEEGLNIQTHTYMAV